MDTTSTSIATSDGHVFRWHDTGSELLAAELEAITQASKEVLLEHYIFRSSSVADRFREELTAAARRGVKVTLLLDAVGCFLLPNTYFNELTACGGQVIWFNPAQWRSWIFRDHRKILVVDGARAFVGGCNIAPEYEGDGITEGWRDGGVEVTGPVVKILMESFADQVSKAGRWKWARRRKRNAWIKAGDDVSVLLTRPGFHQNAFQWALQSDLRRAKDVAITMAYFLPVGRMKRMLLKAARQTGRFRLLLPGKIDVPVIQVATRALYGTFQRSGAQIFEYQPQVLHAKVLIIDDVVYVGSSNLDPRSISINFEVMLRVRSASLARQAMATFEKDLVHSTAVPRQSWRKAAGWWSNIKQKLARAVFTRLDLGVAQALAQKVESEGMKGRRTE